MTTAAESSTVGTGSGESSTGEVPEPCVGITDDFDDGSVDRYWEPYGSDAPAHTMEEVGSSLRWGFATGVVELVGVQRVLDMQFGRARVHVTETPVLPMAAAQIVLTIREYLGDEQHSLVWANGVFEVRDGAQTLESIVGVEWVEVANTDDGLLVSRSEDGVEFQPVMTLAPGIDIDDTRIALYGQTRIASPETATGAVDFLQICAP